MTASTPNEAWWRHQAKFILFDSCFWIGLIENESKDYKDFIDTYIDRTFLIPYPSFAEFLNDIPLRNELKFKTLREVFLNQAIEKIYYKHNLKEDESISILNEYFSSSSKAARGSVPNFVDIIIGKIIEEMRTPFAFVTKNSGDFAKYINSNRALCHVVDFGKKQVTRW